ncbi:MAG: GNAT family N-acetyltransferase [Oscillospiraceae bacterium]|nr:GNAT family N-acetyltransferase [Oscillospiraceae bacterium]
MIETPRLFIRPFEESDLDLIYRIYSDEELLRYTPFDTMDRAQAGQHLRRIMEDWRREPCLSMEFAVCLRETGAKIGRTHILTDPETDTGMIGTFLLQEYWGVRYATEIAEALIACCFNRLGLHRVNAVCNPENTASWKVLEKCGLRREALLLEKCRYVKNGVISWHDELEYAMLASEYKGQNRDCRHT